MSDKAQSNIADDLEEGGFDRFLQDDDTSIEPAQQGQLQSEELPPDDGLVILDGPEPRQQQTAVEDDEPGDSEADRYRRVATEAENRAALADANRIMEVAQAQAQAVQVQYDSAKVGIDTLDFRIQTAQEALVQAEENGDTKAKIEIQRAIGKMEALKGELEAGRNNMASPQQIINRAKQQAESIVQAARSPRGEQINETTRAMNPLAHKWAKENAWMADPGHKQAHEYVIATSAHLVKNGWQPDDPRFYAELSKRVQGSFPNLRTSNTQTQRAAPRPGVRTPVAPGRSSSGSSSRPAVTRTADGKQTYSWQAGDKAAMARMNLSPSNPKHVSYFVKSRLESAARGQS